MYIQIPVGLVVPFEVVVEVVTLIVVVEIVGIVTNFPVVP